MRNEPMDQDREIQVIGKLEHIFPRKCKRNGTRPKALKIQPTQNGRGRSLPLHRVTKHGKQRFWNPENLAYLISEAQIPAKPIYFIRRQLNGATPP